MCNMAYFLRKIGEYNKALPLYEEALQGSIEIFGDQHPQTLALINELASLRNEMSVLKVK